MRRSAWHPFPCFRLLAIAAALCCASTLSLAMPKAAEDADAEVTSGAAVAKPRPTSASKPATAVAKKGKTAHSTKVAGAAKKPGKTTKQAKKTQTAKPAKTTKTAKTGQANKAHATSRPAKAPPAGKKAQRQSPLKKSAQYVTTPTRQQTATRGRTVHPLSAQRKSTHHVRAA